jgi:NADPH-dependent curcumin reductase CurA
MHQRRVVLQRVPRGVPEEQDFQIAEAPVPDPPPGHFLARTIYLSLDPYIRSVLAGRHLGHRPVAIGDLIPGQGVAQVVDSRHAGFSPGQYVLLETGWQEYALSDGRDVRILDPHDAPLSAHLGLLGMPGLTAWAGVVELARPRPGETFLVSAASGAVGSAAGQLARLAGCRVVGLAGSAEKCRHATLTFGFDACVNYREADWRDALARATPDGVHVHFENVGGALLEAALDRLALGARVVLCGLIDQYNSGVACTVPAATLIRTRARLFGLVVYDYRDRFDTYLARARRWLREGRLALLEDRALGLEAAPAAFRRLMTGQNVGKALVVVGPERLDG